MQTVTFNNGVKMPILGYGVYQIPEADTERCVLDAIATGYRSIDTASGYHNEAAVGRAIKACGVPRDQLFITTKLWLTDATYEGTKQAFAKSMKLLGLDYLDLYLIHQPFNDIFGAWRAMTELYKAGHIRAIGVANFAPDRLLDLILHSNVVPALDQVETHPFNQQIQSQAFMAKEGVQIESWGPFAEGRNGLFKNPVLNAIAAKHGKSVGQVVLRWLIQRGIVVIPKSVHKERMAENFDLFGFTLDAADLKAIATLDTGKGLFFDHHNPVDVRAICTYR